MKTKQKSLREVKHHLENTSWYLIKVYNKKQLAMMDGIDQHNVEKYTDRYLPVRIDNKHRAFLFYTPWYKANKPYSTWWIRLDEIRGIYKKRTGKNLISY